jgi:hypothetical protein
MTPQAIPKLNHLPSALAREGAVCLELEDGVAIFRASTAVQTRIEELLQLEKESAITPAQKNSMPTKKLTTTSALSIVPCGISAKTPLDV